MISFQNPGLIDVRAVKTMGVSVKETENPIGYFGTGLKYAIAIILRERGALSIWRGLEEFAFGIIRAEIRGKPVDLVAMNGEELGFTIDLGKNWEPWQAFRELWCNAQDEGGAVTNGRADPREDVTTIHLGQEGIERCFFHLEDYFLTGKPVYHSPYVSFHDREGKAIFYRQVRVGDIGGERPFRFAPNVIEPLALTEDRTVKSDWDFRVAVARTILWCADEDFIERWLTTGKVYVENAFDLDWDHIKPSQEFLRVAKRLMTDTSRAVNYSAFKVVTRHESELPDVAPCDLLEDEYASVREAIEFCKALAYPVDEFPIIFVESLGEGILGKADCRRRRIFIARAAIAAGDRTLAGTLLEEWIHIKHGHDDLSRSMQNYLFDAVIRLGREYLAAARKLP